MLMNETLQYGPSTVYLYLLLSDWCISRQLWWGHQVPAYQVELPNCADKQEVVSVNICLFNNTIVKSKCCTSHYIQCNPEWKKMGWLNV